MNDINDAASPAPGWICRPQDIHEKIAAWVEAYPDLVAVASEPTYSGHEVYAVTVGSGVKAMLSAVPHAHEPGGTAASMELLSQLVTGEGLTGAAGELDRERILRELTLTIIPAGNPDGLARSPRDAWEGVPTTEFLQAMKGVDVDGELLPWVPVFDSVEARVGEMGIVYEQIAPTKWAEPNRSREAALWKLIDRLSDNCQYHQLLHLHQGMEAWEKKDFWLEYPTDDWLPQEPVQYCKGWSHAVLRAAAAAGATPEYETGHYLPYRTRELWSDNDRRIPWLIDWLALKQATPSLTVEVQNNNPNTPAEEQRAFAFAALVASMEYLLSQEICP